jgi:hypothetical protein
MRIGYLVPVVLLTATAVPVMAQGSPPSIDADKFVAMVMQLPGPVDLSFNEHVGRTLGDRVAIAIANQIRLTDLRDPDKSKHVLLLLRYAFAEPELIQSNESRQPGVTLLLLDYMADQSGDESIRRAAQALGSKVRAFKSSLDR